jgi:DNA-binding SARP family transcriptional activator
VVWPRGLVYGLGFCVRVEVLGPVRVCAAGGQVVAVPRLERMLVAVLALHAGRVVPVADVVDALWGESPPQRARNQVHKAVSGLRAHLSQAGVDPSVVVTEPAGYRLAVPPEAVDLRRFRELVVRAHSAVAAERAGEAREALRAALGLWRGPALAGETSAVLCAAAESLEEERARATEECLEAELACGGAGELVAELTALVRRYPYREGLYAALMTALHRAGRSAEALATFRRARALLREELGTEPGPRLRQVHQAVLRGDPALEVAGAAVSAGVGSRSVPTPRELPAEASWFVGRSGEAARVRRVLGSAGDERRRPVVVLLYGPGGVGKSALAARVGHEVAGAFADGQVYVDLCGSTPGMRPLSAADVLGRLLRSLGVDPREIPSEVADAAALLRSVAAGRRLLLVLDNAVDAEQVVPVLPASGSCAVLVTSRHPLPVLDVDDRLRLQGLPEADSVRLLTGLAGDREVEPEAAQAIVAATGGLPLAVRVAGGRLAARPDLPAAEYAERLADDSRRLDELAVDRLDVRSCIRVAYDALTGGDEVARRAARAFRTLGVLHVPDVAPGVVAAMLDERDVTLAEAALDRLVAAQLLEPVPGGRYRLHDLVRLVATELATAHDSQPERDATFQRAFAYYTKGFKQADDIRRPSRSAVWGDPPGLVDGHSPTITCVADVLRWLDTELHSAVAAFEHACASHRPLPELVWLGGALWDSLDRRCEWHTAYRVSLLLEQALDTVGSPDGQAYALLLRARSEATSAEYDRALDYFRSSLTLMRQSGNHGGTSVVLIGLALTEQWQGELARAHQHLSEALALATREGLDGLLPTVNTNLSVVLAGMDRLEEALGHARQAVACSLSQNNIQTCGTALNNVAAIHAIRGEYEQAIRHADEALAITVQSGDRLSLCEGTVIRAEINRRRGLLTEAVDDLDTAIARAGNDYGFVRLTAQRQLSKIRDEKTSQPAVQEARTGGGTSRRERFRDSIIELLLEAPEPGSADANGRHPSAERELAARA